MYNAGHLQSDVSGSAPPFPLVEQDETGSFFHCECNCFRLPLIQILSEGADKRVVGGLLLNNPSSFDGLAERR